MKPATIKNFSLFQTLIVLSLFTHFAYAQQTDFTSANNKFPQSYNINTSQKIIITDLPGKKGEEVGDTTIVVKTELKLYAGLYSDGRYKSEISVDWFWSGTSHAAQTPKDTAIFLGSGKKFFFKPTTVDTGFIFVKSTSHKIQWDSTGTITIIHSENLIFDPIRSDRTKITQGQEGILVSFQVENTGLMPSHIIEAGLEMFDPNSQIISDDYQIKRMDTVTSIPIGQKREFKFLVHTKSEADTVLVTIDGKLSTEGGLYTNFEQKHYWQVQAPPLLNIDLIDALIEQVFPGQQGLIVLMQVSNKGGASVHNIKAEIIFWHNGQDVSYEYEYQLSEENPQIIPGHSSASIKILVEVKPSATLGPIVINGKITAFDVNTGLIYLDEGADVPASWIVTQNLATSVGILSTKVNCPNSDEAGDGKVNIHQRFGVEVTVKNFGNEDVHDVGLSLFSDGFSIFNSDISQVIPLLLKNQSQTIRYDIVAYAEELPVMETFSARIDGDISTVSGKPATINPAFDSLANVLIMQPANLVLGLDTTFLQIPVGQIFEVGAKIFNAPENADFDSSGKLTIRLPKDYDLVSPNLTQSIWEHEKVIWQIKAPPLPHGVDSILVYISQTPHDKNNPAEYARVTNDSIFFVVETVVTFLEIAHVSITAPPGAMDDTLSTEQEFVVQAKIRTQKIEEIYVQITPPVPYKNLDLDEKPLANDTLVAWSLKAPDYSTYIREKMIIKARGNRENDTKIVRSEPDSSLSVLTVLKANLKVNGEIIAPPSARQGQISPGLTFQIKGEILNLGDANTFGNKSLELIIDPQDQNNFEIHDDLVLHVLDDSVVWTIRASENLNILPKIIKIKINDIPYDENTDNTAYIAEDNEVTDIQVFAATGVGRLELMVKRLTAIAPTVIAPGLTEIMMGFECTNLTTESGYFIKINSLKFDVEDKNHHLIPPTSVISGFRVKKDNSIPGLATTILTNPIEVPFTPPISLNSQETERLYVEVDFSENLSQQFKLNIKDSSYINVDSNFDVLIVDEFRNSTGLLNLRSHCPVVMQKDLKGSFCNYPNPFGNSGRKITHFVYYLSQETDIELNIYTLIGELVWSCSYSKNEPQGKKGLHHGNEIVWDGRNLKGFKVLNGVYIARINTDYGEWAITKLAVIK